ncbi:MAG TPA: DMT family transporter [Gammaproteobacteria bacterium]|jgi:drug/metabolite transporter (DMT)-like permease|nr:DMT family transporter [Gammaproteobacteria bacterium]
MWQLVLGAVMISFSAVFVKLVTVPPTTSAFYRMLFGGLILLGVLLWRRERPRLNSAAFGLVFLAGLFFAADLALWHRSILHVGPGIATLLANFQVFILAVTGVLLFREHLTRAQMAAIPLAVLGLALLVGSDWSRLPESYRIGVGFGLLTACCYAAYILVLRHLRADASAGSAFTAITLVSLMTAVLLGLLMLSQHDSFAIPDWRNAGWLIAYGIFGQVLGWVLISNGIHKVRASQVGLILLLQPLFAFIWDCTFFGRRFSLIEISGAVLALVAIYLGSLRRPARLK